MCKQEKFPTTLQRKSYSLSEKQSILVDNDQLSVAHDLLRIVGRISRVMLHVGLCVFYVEGGERG